MRDYLDAVNTTARRRHDTLWTVWYIESGAGLLFTSLEAARAHAFDLPVAVSIYPPIYG